MIPEAQPPAASEPLQFTGKAGEYFGIWIVNLFLTIITLGIYSAWAKVRKRRYFYGNTWLAGSNFEYHANPVAILKGRIIALAALVAYTLAGQLSPRFAGAVALALIPFVPWILVRSFAFNATNSSYRNLRFHFKATYREALACIWPVALLPALAIVLPHLEPGKNPDVIDMLLLFIPLVVFALIYPFLVGKTRLLHVNHSRFGTAPFACSARLMQFYNVYIIALFLMIAGGAVVGIVFTAVFAAFGVAPGKPPPLALVWVPLVLIPVLYVGGGSLLFGYTQSRVGNLVFNHTKLDGRVGFKSTLKARKLAWIFATNILAVICSLGLAIPWATIRSVRYRAECLRAECEGGLEGFLADAAANVSATGDQLGEMFDFDVSL
jgi:uncharacterized membrane protein YjgN (DUF898 family)